MHFNFSCRVVPEVTNVYHAISNYLGERTKTRKGTESWVRPRHAVCVSNQLMIVSDGRGALPPNPRYGSATLCLGRIGTLGLGHPCIATTWAIPSCTPPDDTIHVEHNCQTMSFCCGNLLVRIGANFCSGQRPGLPRSRASGRRARRPATAGTSAPEVLVLATPV